MITKDGVVTENFGALDNKDEYIKAMKEEYDAMREEQNENHDSIGERLNDTITADVPASHESTASVETPVSQKQAENVNAEKDAKSDMVMSAFKNILPQWAKNLLQNPAIPALMVGLTAGPLAGVATFGAGALAKQFVKMNDTINAYKNKLVEDKDIQLTKDGTLAYTGTGTIRSADDYFKSGGVIRPVGINPLTGLDNNKFAKSIEGVPTPHQPQSPPTVDEKPKAEPKKEEPKKEEPKKEEPKKEEPKTEPKKEEPKKETSKTEPKKEEPKKEEPKKETPKKEEPKAEPKKEEPSIPQPVGGVSPKVPETQPTVEIPAPINQAPTTEAKPADKGDVIVTKPRVIKVGGEEKENEEVEPKSGSSKESRETDGEDKEDSKDSNVGIWENRDDIDANDTKDNKGGDYSNNNDNKTVSSAYEDLINSITEPTVPSDDGPEL